MEKKKRILKTMLSANDICPTQQLPLYEEYYKKMMSDNSSSKIHNYCTYTYRGHGIIRPFKMSRLVFKRLARQNQLPGIIKKP